MSALFVLYCLLFAILAVHEMDSVMNEEWKLFRLPGGSPLFLLVHLPIFFYLLLASVWVYGGLPAGRITALLLGAAGIAGFLLHGHFLIRGDRRFRSRASIILLTLMPLSGAATMIAAL